MGSSGFYVYHVRLECGRSWVHQWSYGVMVSVLPSCVIDHVLKTWSCGVMFSVLPSCVIDHVFKTWSCVTNDN